jgi:ATP-dependent exoDNAse (exonuclease V) alpha subunit
VGKSYVLSRAVELLQKRYGVRGVIVTASTGVAAAHIGGITLHSFAAVGVEKIKAQAAVNKMSPRAKNVWQQTQVLIIDEISMVNGWFLTLLEEVGRIVRDEPDLPMGGIRVIMVGDFLQLPPVKDKIDADVQFAFESEGWRRLAPRHVLLTHDHRQSDSDFIAVLGEARLGALSERSVAFLQEHVIDTEEHKKQWLDGKPPPSYLFPKNADVDAHNERQLSKLPGDTVIFRAKDDVYHGSLDALKGVQAPPELKLRVGAEVMYLINTSVLGGWFNGARGVITELDEKKKHVRMRLHETGRTANLDPAQWEIKRGDVVLARRQQFPIRLAWAVTMHKAQGQTITGPVVFPLDSSVFEYAQAYVALSRVRNAGQLGLQKLRAACVRAHPKALAFESEIRKGMKRTRDEEDTAGPAEPAKKRAKGEQGDITLGTT